MRILWLCNVAIPAVSALMGESAPVFGGWLSREAELLMREHSLFVLFRHDSRCVSGGKGNLSYQSFCGRDDEQIMEQALRQFRPDIIHIWGTEIKHSDDFVKIVERLGQLDRCVISLQGLMGPISYHYSAGVPESVQRRYTLRDFLKRDRICDAQRRWTQRGEYERDALERAKNVIGRTEWDRAIATQINPNLRYFHCDETLRQPFYGRRWSLEGVQRRSIFVSQCGYALKGFHRVLEAMPLILRQYPDALLTVTGGDLLHLSAAQRLKLPGYGKYLVEEIDALGLRDHVRFLGTLDAEAMAEQYLRSHVFVSASSIENSSNSVGEAMLLGCPVVSSWVGGVPSMMDHGKEGFFYQADAPYLMAHYVCRIFGDDDLARRLSEQARTRAAVTHDPEKNHRQMLEVYDALVH